mmetsp:Transcript_3130/g.8419  ORF Transcript_3130/g.8419 Transcript_3130/m.8419 type:complete len:181 (+) Transcript_3130:102-644(+)
MQTGAALCAICAAVLPWTGSASAWVQKKCAGEQCTDPQYPILDYNGDKCVCRQHPCWNDDGKVHSCVNPEAPYLAFAYLADGKLVCSCQKNPHFGSVYLAQDVCPGSTCTEENTPILEYSEDSNGCVCSSHPCLNDNGMTHSCKDDATSDYPILTFSYDKNEKLKCGCSKKFVPPGEKEL